MKKALAAGIVASLLLLALVLGAAARRAKSPSPPTPPIEDVPLERALVEARANAEAARLLAVGSPRVLLRTEELDLALRSSPALARDQEEHVRLILVARLVRDLGRAFARGETARRLEEERLTEEDVRFLLGALEARLARAAGREPPERPSSFDPALLREFRGLGFDDGLRRLFD
jgi:hypothetical protein